MVSSYVKGSDAVLCFLGCAVPGGSRLWRTYGERTLAGAVTGFVPLPEGFFCNGQSKRTGLR
ncbi:hypothetical protein D3C73_1557600 [compost metagenome]